jgi:hypothetical protein
VPAIGSIHSCPHEYVVRDSKGNAVSINSIRQSYNYGCTLPIGLDC